MTNNGVRKRDHAAFFHDEFNAGRKIFHNSADLS